MKRVEDMSIEDLKEIAEMDGIAVSETTVRIQRAALARRLIQAETRPYPDNEGKTHYDDCWKDRGHHNCAVARVELLEGIIDRALRLIEEEGDIEEAVDALR